MLNIKIKLIGILLIILSLVSIILIKIKNEQEYHKHIRIIDDIFINGKANTSKYVGYIEIKSVNIKRGITEGITEKVLNENEVGMEKKDNIILAGHSVSNVFGRLHYINVGDLIKMLVYNREVYFTVIDKIIVRKDNMDYLNEDLVLITCMINPNKRLLIIAKKNT